MVAKSAQTPRYVVCKRVLGIEGDRVKVRPAVGTDLPYYVEVAASPTCLLPIVYLEVPHLSLGRCSSY